MSNFHVPSQSELSSLPHGMLQRSYQKWTIFSLLEENLLNLASPFLILELDNFMQT